MRIPLAHMLCYKVLLSKWFVETGNLKAEEATPKTWHEIYCAHTYKHRNTQ